MAGFVNIGGILVPESSKPRAPFRCRICGTECTGGAYEQHIAKCVKRNEAELQEMHPRAGLRDFYGGHDRERQDWLQSPAGRAWWYRKMNWTDPKQR